MKVLNLYAGIGGNRKLWTDVEVTAVEWDPKIAAIYQDFFPDDTVVVADAHQYLLDHFREFDFIWSSPPCPTHSVLRHLIHSSKNGQDNYKYPDMKLYEEIILLDHWFDGLYCVENVKSYYEPLIKPQYRARHYFWANFHITSFRTPGGRINIADTYHKQADLEKDLEEYHGFDLSGYKITGRGGRAKLQTLRNCVYPPLGLHILDCARGRTQLSLTSF